ncbi:MAG TPA: YggT family protein [Candidatus Eremiobacteraceae bacterium]|nr:YggT family protein [Candidatus Eremiobacteraceae bacterium]
MNPSSSSDHLICTLFAMARIVLNAEAIAIVARVITSWLPDLPAWIPTLLRRLTDGALLPFQTLIPLIGGLDFSPMAAILVLQAIVHYVPVCPTG